MQCDVQFLSCMRLTIIPLPELLCYLRVVRPANNADFHFPPQSLEELVQLWVNFLQITGNHFLLTGSSLSLSLVQTHRPEHMYHHLKDKPVFCIVLLNNHYTEKTENNGHDSRMSTDLQCSNICMEEKRLSCTEGRHIM